MLPLLADENFNADILDAVFRLQPTIDIITARDASLLTAPDPLVLDWAASRGRVVLSHDVNTRVGHAYERVSRTLPMPGVIAVHGWCPIAGAAEDVALLACCLNPAEIDGEVRFVPL
jgi:hypothetical protein